MARHTCVNDTGGLGSLGAFADGPLADFIRAASEETTKLESVAHGHNDLGQRRLGAELLAFFIGLSLGLKSR